MHRDIEFLSFVLLILPYNIQAWLYKFLFRYIRCYKEEYLMINIVYLKIGFAPQFFIETLKGFSIKISDAFKNYWIFIGIIAAVDLHESGKGQCLMQIFHKGDV